MGRDGFGVAVLLWLITIAGARSSAQQGHDNPFYAFGVITDVQAPLRHLVLRLLKGSA